MKIELLAPSGTVNIARSAILSGADAIYIGGPSFGARHAAANAMNEIGELVKFAHGYGARVYLTMNTILMDSELDEAKGQAEQAWTRGVDALIIQDLAYLKMELPPIELHSSTQMFNKSMERVKMHEGLGFARIVLERGLTLNEIKEIRKETSVELEAFIHGAICVGYSGQCYLSQALCGRGGNRGICAQSCRSNYDVKRISGDLLAKDKQVLSVGDMNLSDRIGALIGAGVCSLKIEGRLKDESYVVNNVAHYDDILRDLGVDRVAAGRCVRKFKANPNKSFSRPFTHYFLDDSRAKVGAASKSLGEYLGTVKSIKVKSVILTTDLKLNTGDGICWMGDNGAVVGTNINAVSGAQIIVNGEVPKVGVKIYRNFDRLFSPSSKDVERRVRITISVDDEMIVATDNEGFKAELAVDMSEFEQAKNQDAALGGIKEAMSKSGDTIFEVSDVEVNQKAVKFVPRSVMNGWRKELLDKLLNARLNGYVRRERIVKNVVQAYEGTVDYRANLSNALSVSVMEELGMTVAERALECGGDAVGREVMRTRFCIRREMGICPRQNREEKGAEPLILENNGQQLEARFDCKTCEMAIIYLG